MGRACSTELRPCTRDICDKFRKQNLPGRPKHRHVYNIKMYLRERGCGDMDWDTHEDGNVCLARTERCEVAEWLHECYLVEKGSAERS
jgi:hypothetical protein